MIRAASLDIGVDLREFSQALAQRGIGHRINEESGLQVIWVESEAEANYVQEALRGWQSLSQSERMAQPDRPVGRRIGSGSAYWNQAWLLLSHSPVTLSLIGLCAVVALISELGRQVGRVDFLFYPLVATDSLPALLAEMLNPVNLLRSLTPMFLHFGELHLIFNLLWLYYFGRQLEHIQPGWVVLAVVIITSFASNTTQYLNIGYNNFGGMSGVVYGLVGYAWVIHNFMPRSLLMLNNSMFMFFVFALILMEVVAGSWIATAAHVGGLLSGLALGGVVVGYYRGVLNRPVVGRPGAGMLWGNRR